ncbi:hypothetical protein [Bradyrhizobium sp. USDA 10063]
MRLSMAIEIRSHKLHDLKRPTLARDNAKQEACKSSEGRQQELSTARMLAAETNRLKLEVGKFLSTVRAVDMAIPRKIAIILHYGASHSLTLPAPRTRG